jgi:plastocyanin
MRRLLLLVPVSLVLVAAAMACGGSDDDDGDTPAVTPASAVTTVQEITIHAGERGEEYYYDPKQLNLKVGPVRVTFINNGPERGHTFNVKNKSGEGDLFKSDQVATGQTVTMSLLLTEEGTYQFLCTNRGHADRGQTGTITVTKS